MKILPLEVPILDKPKLEPGLVYAILHEICHKHIYFNPKWTTQTGQKETLIDLLQDIVNFELFKSNKKCVIQVTLHTLTLTLNLPVIRTIINLHYDLFLKILNQLETLPSNRFYTDSVCFKNPYAKPTYSPELRTWVQIHHYWIDTVRPKLGSSLFKSKFDDNPSTGKAQVIPYHNFHYNYKHQVIKVSGLLAYHVAMSKKVIFNFSVRSPEIYLPVM